MKHICFALIMMISTTAFAGVTITEKVLKAFNAIFPKAEKAKWYEYEKTYEVLFENNGISCRVKYDAEGKMIFLRRDYNENELSSYIRAKLREKYPGSKIFGVTEITSSEGLYYTIFLEDEKSYTTVKSNDSGEFSMVQKTKKHNTLRAG